MPGTVVRPSRNAPERALTGGESTVGALNIGNPPEWGGDVQRVQAEMCVSPGENRIFGVLVVEHP